MNSQPRIIGNHVYFFRDGEAFTQPAAGTASRTAKPAMSDAGWLEFGSVDKLDIVHDKEEKEIYAPSPSRLELQDVLQNKRKTTIKFDTQNLSPIAYELAFHTKPLTGANGAANQAAYNPGAGEPVKGWLHVEQFGPDSDETPVNTVDLYVYLSLDGDLKFDENVVRVSLAGMKLNSTLNVGALIVG